MYKNNFKCILAPEADKGASKSKARLVEFVRSQGTGVGETFRFGIEEVTIISSTQVILTEVILTEVRTTWSGGDHNLRSWVAKEG